jgi:thioredoxin 1
MVIHVNDNNFEEEVLKDENLVLVDFFANWCGPCKMLSPIIEEISSQNIKGLKVVKVDVDKANKTAVNYGVMSIPTIILFKDGKEIYQTVGYHTKDELEKLIRDNLN